MAFLKWCRLHMQINGTISRRNLFLVHSTWACQVSPELFLTQNTHGTLCAQQRVASPRGNRTGSVTPGAELLKSREEEFAAGWEKETCSKSDGSIRTELQPHSRLSAKSLRAGSPTRLNLSLTVTMLSPEKEQETQREGMQRGEGVEDSKRGGLSWCDRAWTRHGDRHTWERKRESVQALIEKTGNRCGGS